MVIDSSNFSSLLDGFFLKTKQKYLVLAHHAYSVYTQAAEAMKVYRV